MPPFSQANSRYDLFSPDKTYCITMKCIEPERWDKNRNRLWIRQMEEIYNAKTVILKHNMRNSETIANVSTCFDHRLEVTPIQTSVIPNKNITGPVCYHYHNIHELDEDMLARAAILKYFHESHQPVLILLPNTFASDDTYSFYVKLQKYFSTDRNIVYLPEDGAKNKLKVTDYEKYMRQMKEYLEEPKGILVTNIYLFHGAQARNKIILADVRDKVQYENLRNTIMRTMSFAIIIHIRDIKHSVPGLARDHDLHQFLPPEDTEQLFCNSKTYYHRRCSLPPTVINITPPAMETKVKRNLRKLRKTYTLQFVLMFLFVMFLMYFIKEDQWLQQDSRRDRLKSTEIKTTQPPYSYQKPFLISRKVSKFTMFPPLNHLYEEPEFPVLQKSATPYHYNQWLNQDFWRKGLKITEIKTTQPPSSHQKTLQPFLIRSGQTKFKLSKFNMFPPLNHLYTEPKFPNPPKFTMFPPLNHYYEEPKFPMPPKLERYPTTLNHFDKEPKFPMLHNMFGVEHRAKTSKSLGSGLNTDLRLAGHAIRHPELPLSKVILWKPLHGHRGRERPRATFVDNQLIDSGVVTTICNLLICNYLQARDPQAGQNGVEKFDPGSSGSSR